MASQKCTAHEVRSRVLYTKSPKLFTGMEDEYFDRASAVERVLEMKIMSYFK
jgi:hypothetical protein